MNEEELLKKLREAFGIEARERLESLSSRLLSLEKGTGGKAKAEDLEVAFREAHSLKGAARSVNISEIETICQAVEGVFAAMKRNEIQLSGDDFDLFHRCVKTIEEFVTIPESKRPDRTEEIADLVSQLKGVQSGEERKIPEEKPRERPAPIEQERSRRPPSSSSVRVSTDKLDTLFLKAEELVSMKLSLDQHLADLKGIVRRFEGWKGGWNRMENEWRSLQKDGRKGDAREGLGSFLEQADDAFRSLETDLRRLARESEQKNRVFGLMVNDLLSDMKQVRMLPFATLLDLFPRMVREISRDQGKNAELIVRGGEVEIDRRILEEMKDPFIHILRNAVDHGLESPGEREKKGKPRAGTIEMTISQVEGGKVEVRISDDGAGIDLLQVKKKARSLGVVTEHELEQLNDRDALSLVLRSGVSTSPIITDISGRGLGLAIVQEKVETLGGALALDTVPGRGASFRMKLPVTIATFRGIQVQVADRSFIVPNSGMERTVRVHKDHIRTVENRATIPLNGMALSLVDLARVFGLGGGIEATNRREYVTVAVLTAGDRRIGFRVDEVLGEQEVLVKDLGKQLRHVPFISGATILGSGRVVPILNVAELLTSSLNDTAEAFRPRSLQGEGKRRSILVAEDSITSRMLLKGILEGAGYRVKTAVDGSEAFATLKTDEFDLVVSDIEMPRMDGFELTRKIRSDKHYADIPVVLVTGLETRDDREKGIDAGANAYIVKSSFDQSNLLEVIRRMI